MKDLDYRAEGMSLGMSLGCVVGAFNIIDIGTALSLGMLFGLAVGMLIKKGNIRKNND